MSTAESGALPPAELDAIRQRWEKATPGDWAHTAGYVHARAGIVCIIAEPEGRWIPSDAKPVELGSKRFHEAMENGEFIAHSWKDIRALLASDAALRDALRRVETLAAKRVASACTDDTLNWQVFDSILTEARAALFPVRTTLKEGNDEK